MRILAVDTSSERGSVCVTDSHDVVGEVRLASSIQYSERLFRSIEFLFLHLPFQLSDIDLFVAARGPGSFTGLRVGLAAMEAFVAAHGKRGRHGLFFVVKPDREQLGNIATLIDSGAIRPVIAETIPLAKARQALAPRPGQVGALVAVAGKWVGLDLLASPGLFERAWPRLCAGYAAEAVGRQERAPAPDPHATLKGLTQTPVEEAPAVGLGREYRLAGNAMVGAALVVEEQVAHLMVFPTRFND